MGNITRYNVNLGLPATPDVNDPDTLAAVAPIYNALRALAGGLDNFTGTAYVDPKEYSDMPDTTAILSSNSNKIYRKFGEAIIAGQTVRISGALAYKGTNGTVVGFAASSYDLNEWGLIILQGLWGISGVTAGEVYCAGNTAGTIALASALPSNQKLGRAISTNGIFFNPALA